MWSPKARNLTHSQCNQLLIELFPFNADVGRFLEDALFVFFGRSDPMNTVMDIRHDFLGVFNIYYIHYRNKDVSFCM